MPLTAGSPLAGFCGARAPQALPALPSARAQRHDPGAAARHRPDVGRPGRSCAAAHVRLDRVRTPHGYRSLWIRCADTFKLLREQLQDEIGRLSEDETDLVASCAQTLLDGSSFIGDERFGAPVFTDHDPRLHAAEDWKLSTSRWREPWKVLAVADELGAVCAVRREHLGLSVTELAEDVDINAEDWTRFEAAQLDVPASLPTLRLAAAVRKLSLPQGRKLLMLAAASVTLTHRPDAGATAPALARRRQGIRRKASPPDPAEIRKAADDYSAALGRALGL